MNLFLDMIRPDAASLQLCHVWGKKKIKKNTELSITACVMCLTSCDKQDVSQSSVFLLCATKDDLFSHPLYRLYDDSVSVWHQSLPNLSFSSHWAHRLFQEPQVLSLDCFLITHHLLTRVNLCPLQCTPPQQPMLTSPLTPVTMTKTGTHTWATGTVSTGWRTLTWCVMKFHELSSLTFQFSLLSVFIYLSQRLQFNTRSCWTEIQPLSHTTFFMHR